MSTSLRTRRASFSTKWSFIRDILNCKRLFSMPLIGYARVSTEDQTPLPQSEALQTVGCVEIYEEHASGGNRARSVRRLRPDMAWEDVLRIINGPLPHGRHWTQSRLLRAVKAYVRDGFLPAEVPGRAGRRETDDRLPAMSRQSRVLTPRSPCRQSVTDRNPCVSAPLAVAPAGSLHQSECCWSGQKNWGSSEHDTCVGLTDCH